MARGPTRTDVTRRGHSLLERRRQLVPGVLYNKYRGIMRPYIFYGSRAGISHMATHQMGELSVDNGDVAAFTHHTGTYLFDFNPRYQQVFIKKDLYLDRWACLEFDVSGYDPAIADPSKTGASFATNFHGLEVSMVDLNGAIDLSGTLDAANVRTGGTSLAALDMVTTVAGDFLKRSTSIRA